jgi:hypothetical protein
MHSYYKGISIIVFISLLLACNGGKISTKSDVNNTKRIASYDDGDSMFSMMLEEGDLQLDENLTNESYELYFHDSRSKRYLSNMRSSDVLSASVERLISDVMRSASHRMSNYTRKRQLNLVLEVEGQGSYRESVVNAGEQYILSQKRYTLQSQDDAMQSVVSKILKRELDPFYEGASYTNLTAKASDFIMFIKFNNRADVFKFKGSLLSKSGEVLAVSTKKLDLESAKNNKSQWVDVVVPFSDGNSVKNYKVMKRTVTNGALFGRGSKLHSAIDMNLNQANQYCTMQHALPMSVFAFEHARRARKILPPTGSASEELIAPFDIEEDESFLRAGDHLEVNDSGSLNHIIVFNWVTERYSAVSKSYRSSKMAFRCMEN